MYINEAYAKVYNSTKPTSRRKADLLVRNVLVRERIDALKEQNAKAKGLSREEKRLLLAKIARGEVSMDNGYKTVPPTFRERIQAIQEDNRMTGDSDEKMTPPTFNITFTNGD